MKKTYFALLLTILIPLTTSAFNPQRTYKRKCLKCHSETKRDKYQAPSLNNIEMTRGLNWVKEYFKTTTYTKHKFTKYSDKKTNELINYMFIIGAGSDKDIQQLKGNFKAGRILSSSCVTCHGPGGYAANPETAHLRGQNATYLIKQLKAFRDGERIDENETMSAIAKSLTDRDIVNISTYYEQLNNDH